MKASRAFRLKLRGIRVDSFLGGRRCREAARKLEAANVALFDLTVDRMRVGSFLPTKCRGRKSGRYAVKIPSIPPKGSVFWQWRLEAPGRSTEVPRSIRGLAARRTNHLRAFRGHGGEWPNLVSSSMSGCPTAIGHAMLFPQLCSFYFSTFYLL